MWLTHAKGHVSKYCGQALRAESSPCVTVSKEMGTLVPQMNSAKNMREFRSGSLPNQISGVCSPGGHLGCSVVGTLKKTTQLNYTQISEIITGVVLSYQLYGNLLQSNRKPIHKLASVSTNQLLLVPSTVVNGTWLWKKYIAWFLLRNSLESEDPA